MTAMKISVPDGAVPMLRAILVRQRALFDGLVKGPHQAAPAAMDGLVYCDELLAQLDANNGKEDRKSSGKRG